MYSLWALVVIVAIRVLDFGLCQKVLNPESLRTYINNINNNQEITEVGLPFDGKSDITLLLPWYFDLDFKDDYNWISWWCGNAYLLRHVSYQATIPMGEFWSTRFAKAEAMQWFATFSQHKTMWRHQVTCWNLQKPDDYTVNDVKTWSYILKLTKTRRLHC